MTTAQLMADALVASLRAKDSGWIEISERNGLLEFMEPVSGWVWRVTTDGKMVHVRTEASEHDWIDVTTIDSLDYRWMCAGCGLTKTEPKTHWPLYPRQDHQGD